MSAHEQHRDPDCIFCKILAGQIPADVVYEDEHVLAFKDIQPMAPVHILVIPKTHIETLNDLEAPGNGAAIEAVMKAARPVAEAVGVVEEGYRVFFNVGEGAGQVVFHIHMHLIARGNLREIVKNLPDGEA